MIGGYHMNTNLVININEIKKIVTNLNNNKEIVDRLFKEKINSILLRSRNKLENKNISYDDELEKFNKLAEKYNNSISDLISALETRIIPKYENLHTDINSLFNNELVSRLEEILNNKGDDSY